MRLAVADFVMRPVASGRQRPSSLTDQAADVVYAGRYGQTPSATPALSVRNRGKDGNSP